MTIKKEEIKWIAKYSVDYVNYVNIRKKYIVWDFSLLRKRIRISVFKLGKKCNIRINLELGKEKW